MKPLYSRCLLHITVVLLIALLPATAQVAWERIDAGLAAGRAITELAVDSTGRIFALNWDGILYRWEADSNKWAVMWDSVTNDPFNIAPHSLQVNQAGIFTLIRRDVWFESGSEEWMGSSYTSWQSTNGGDSWKPVAGICNVHSNNGIAAIASAYWYNHSFSAGVRSGSIFLSNDSGSTWVQTTANVSMPAMRTVTVTPTNTIIAAGADQTDGGPEHIGLFRSTDLGASWDRIGDSTWNYYEGSLLHYSRVVRRLAVGPDGTLFAAFAPDDTYILYRSTDNGDTWDLVLQRYIQVNHLVIPRTGTILLEYYLTLPRSLRSTDNGDTWSDVPHDIHDFLVAPDGDLYGLGSGHIWRSTDAGGTWEKVSDALPVSATSFTVTPSRHIYAGTQTGSVYRTTRSLSAEDQQTATEHKPGMTAPGVVYGSTIIAITLPQGGHTTVQLHDMLGRRLALLSDATMPAGEHRLLFDASRFSAGMYFLVLQSGESTLARKLIIN